MAEWSYGTPDGGCRLHGIAGWPWSDEYRCAVCGCGGSAHGLWHDPEVTAQQDAEHAKHPGREIAVRPGAPLYCWEHRPAPMTLGLA